MTQEEANKLSYSERFKRYCKYIKNHYSSRISPVGYQLWLQQSNTSNLPPDCRAGQGHEPWQKR